MEIRPVFARFRRVFLVRASRTLACLCLIVTTICAADPAPSESIPNLLEKLRDEDAFMRVRAAHKLGDMGLAARDAVPALAKRLRDPAADVRVRAARSLAAIGTPAVPALLDALKDPQLKGHRDIAEALGRIGPQAKAGVAALTGLLQHRDTAVRAAAVVALGEIDEDGSSAPALVRALHGADKTLRALIVQTLQQMGPAATPALRDGLRDPRPEFRLALLRALESLRTTAKELVPSLRELLKDPDPRTRASAAAVLGWAGEEAKEAVPELLHVLQEKSMRVQVQAANTLVGLAALGVPGVFDKIREVDRKGRWSAPFVLDQFGLRGPGAVAHFIKDLRDKDAKVRLQAATALGALGRGAKAAIAALKKALQDEDADVQIAAAMALTQIDQTNAVDQAIQDRLRGIVRVAPGQPNIAWQQLPLAVVRQRMQNAKLQRRFLSLLHAYVAIVVATDHKPSRGGLLRMQADETLGQLGPEAVPALVEEINRVVQWRLGFC
ncbi:MAG TPA: HEAT repeat domain-containing protein [Gemmataceae bacterium]|jgi:HEAT repeat protein